MRLTLVVIFVAVLASCSTTSKIDYSDQPDSEDFFSVEEKIRLQKLRVDQATPNRASVFVFDEGDHLVFICNHGDCEQFKQEDGFTIYLNSDGSFSSFPRLIKPGTLQICGKGDAFKYIDRHGLWRQLGLKRSRAFMGNRDWSSKDTDFCHHQFTKQKKYDTNQPKNVGVMLMNAISSSIESFGVHIRQLDPEALKKTVIRNNLDTLIQQLYTDDSRKLIGSCKVLEYETASLQRALKEQLDMPVKRNGKHDGIVFFNKSSNPIITPLSFKSRANNDQMPDILNNLSDLLGQRASTGKKNTDFITRFIPPKVQKPVIPTMPTFKKGEFEKQRDFEIRANNFVTEKESEIHRLVQNYNFEVFRRNEYVKAVTGAYHDYLENQSSLFNKDRQAFIENMDRVSQVIIRSLYSDLNVTSFDYDSEAELLYISIVSPRNNFDERVVVSLEPEVAKKIKLEKDYQLSLNTVVEENNLSLTGVIVHHDGDRYTANFTESQFKPMRLVMETVTPTNLDLGNDQQSDYSNWLQRDTDFKESISHTNFYLSLQKNYNLNLPEWFMNPCADCVTFKGNSFNDALSNARAELSRRKQVRVATSQTVNNEMFESSSGQSSYKVSFAETVKTQSDSVLTRDEYRVTKQEEIDGLWYVELMFL